MCAKAFNPSPQFAGAKRLGGRLVARDRKEGFIVSGLPRQVDFEFFPPGTAFTISALAAAAWGALTDPERLEFEGIASALGMVGYQLFLIQYRRGITSGFYGRARYGLAHWGGVVATRFGNLYGLAVYEVANYGKS